MGARARLGRARDPRGDCFNMYEAVKMDRSKADKQNRRDATKMGWEEREEIEGRWRGEGRLKRGRRPNWGRKALAGWASAAAHFRSSRCRLVDNQNVLNHTKRAPGRLALLDRRSRRVVGWPERLVRLQGQKRSGDRLFL